MALQNIRTYFQEVNRNEFMEILKNPCVITEKVQASSFHTKRTDLGYEYFKSGSKTPLSKIDRTLVRYYEPAIKFFESIDKELREEMPKNWKFGFDYMIDTKTVDIEYDKLPKNGLILTHIQVLSNADHSQIKKVIRDPKILYKWADLLDVQRPHVLYQGVLQSDQKDKLINLLESSDQEWKDSFKNLSFARFVYGIFGQSINKTALSDSLDQDIDSLVLNFFDGKTVKTFKMCELIEDFKDDRKPSHMYQISILDIIEFVDGFNFESITLESDEAEQRYIDLICILFNKYIEKNASRYIGANFDSAEFASSENFKISTKYIQDSNTIEILDGNDVTSEIFKIMLGSFRNKRKKESDLINSDMLLVLNNLIEKIESVVMQKNDSESVLSFDTYMLQGKLSKQKTPIHESSSFKTFNNFLENN